MTAKLLAGAATALALGACSLHHNVAWDAIDYNRSMADAANSVVLLNVLRAKDRMPMHFSLLSKVAGKLNYGLSLQMSFPFGQNLSTLGSATNTATPLAKFDGGPSYDVLSDHDKEFIQGILSPVDVERLYHYWNQGWNRDLLLHVFVESIEHVCPGDAKPRVYINTPFPRIKSVNPGVEETAKDEFRNFIKPLLAPSVRMEKQETFRPAGPYLPNTALFKIDAVTAAIKEGALHCRTQRGGREVGCTADTQEKDRRYRMGTRASEIVFVAPSSEVLSPETKTAAGAAPRATSVRIQSIEGFRRTSEATKGRPLGAACSANLVLRSVQGMIYYLGEIVRADAEGKHAAPVIRLRSREAPHNETPEELFLLRPVGIGPGLGDLSITHRGVLFRVPEQPANRSAQVLALVEQLLGLHRKADKFLSTQSVRIIN